MEGDNEVESGLSHFYFEQKTILKHTICVEQHKLFFENKTLKKPILEEVREKCSSTMPIPNF